MGKVLVIKGANFSANCIETIVPPTPSGVVLYDYMLFDGNSYFNTGIYAKPNTKFEFAATPTAWPSSGDKNMHIVGARPSSSIASAFCVRISDSVHGTVNGVVFQIGDRNPQYGTDVNAVLDTKYNISLTPPTAIVNEQTVSNIPVLGINGLYSFYIGATNSEGSPFSSFFGKIYTVTIYEGEQMVASFIPATKNNVPGLYESVSGEFFTNNGEGTVTVGND